MWVKKCYGTSLCEIKNISPNYYRNKFEMWSYDQKFKSSLVFTPICQYLSYRRVRPWKNRSRDHYPAKDGNLMMQEYPLMNFSSDSIWMSCCYFRQFGFHDCFPILVYCTAHSKENQNKYRFRECCVNRNAHYYYFLLAIVHLLSHAQHFFACD